MHETEKSPINAKIQSLKKIERLERKAATGDVNAQFNLGVYYSIGTGVDKNSARAVCYYKQAADRGHAKAQFNLGVRYTNGDGVEKDLTQAVSYYKLAADQGFVDAQYNLGVHYAGGIEKNLVLAFNFYKKAANQGHAKAQFNLGVCYANGDGVEKDLTQAVSYYKQAADQGPADAQFNLGVCYANGDGVKKDSARAVHFYKQAADQGHTQAKAEYEKFNLSNKGIPASADANSNNRFDGTVHKLGKTIEYTNPLPKYVTFEKSRHNQSVLAAKFSRSEDNVRVESITNNVVKNNLTASVTSPCKNEMPIPPPTPLLTPTPGETLIGHFFHPKEFVDRISINWRRIIIRITEHDKSRMNELHEVGLSLGRLYRIITNNKGTLAEKIYCFCAIDHFIGTNTDSKIKCIRKKNDIVCAMIDQLNDVNTLEHHCRNQDVIDLIDSFKARGKSFSAGGYDFVTSFSMDNWDLFGKEHTKESEAMLIYSYHLITGKPKPVENIYRRKDFSWTNLRHEKFKDDIE
jgi:TPR repeat protein